MDNLKAIVAVCDDWGIGANGDMVVSNRADMRHFVSCTKGHTVIMGRKTLESFPGVRPLKDRRNIVLTRDPLFLCRGAEVVHTIEEVLAALEPSELAWVVGGGKVYEQLLPYCCEAEVTRDHCLRNSDTYFPNLDEDPAWVVVSRSEMQQVAEGEGDAGVFYEFTTYRRRDERAGE